MPTHNKLALAALLALCAALPAGAAVADEVCRRPCEFFLPQKGDADPTAQGCRDLIDNLSGTCGISLWDLPGQDDVQITVHSSPRSPSTFHRGNRRHVWIELG